MTMLPTDDVWVWILVSAALLTVIELLLLDRRRRAFMAAAQPRPRSTRGQLSAPRAARTPTETADTGAPPRKRRSHHAVHHILDTMTALPAAAPAPATFAPEPPPAAVTEAPRPNPPAAAVVESPQPEPPPIATADTSEPESAAPPEGGVMPAVVPELPPTDAIAATRAADADVGIIYVDLAGRFTFATQVARDLLEWQSGELRLADILAQGGAAHSAALLKLVAQQEVLDQPVQVLVSGQPRQFEISALALRDRDDKMWGAALFLRRSAGR